MTAEYSLREGGGIDVLNKGYDKRKAEWREIKGVARFIGEKNVGSLKVSFFAPSWGGYHVMALDRENYFYSMVTGPSRSYLRILSRNEMQDQDIFAEFVARAKKWDFDVEKLICVEHDKKRRRPMNVKRKVTLVLMGLVMVMACVLTVAAQEKEADNMQIVLEKVRADKKLLVSENMQLTEAEAKAFWPVYEQYQDELFLLRSRTVKLIKDFADAYEKMTNDTGKKLMDEYITIETLGPKLRQTYLPKFRKVLPEGKVVRYYQIENKINAVLMYELAKNIPLAKTAK